MALEAAPKFFNKRFDWVAFPRKATFSARAVHLHLTQSQILLSRDDHVDVTTVHPTTLELFDSTRRDAVDHGAPGGKRQKWRCRSQDANEETVGV
ncbi:hypothetical protein EYF80_054941 [Liparis tanakae]|uniref:Uncharacterized protein n=1 Tax=Liparis tanakae TaxID=230148 RepID=A0A4Z2F317_9TELE|nr:hypothetical protein EYF80_054941 [Liparis tanakae]